MSGSETGPPRGYTSEDWGELWMAERPFRLEVGSLPNLSVGFEEEARLRRSRWVGGAAVRLPGWYESEDRRGLINYVDAHLTGRQPITGVVRGELWTCFSVLDNSRSTIEVVQEFALSFARERVFGREVLSSCRGDVTYVDTSAYEHLLPEEMRELP